MKNNQQPQAERIIDLIAEGAEWQGFYTPTGLLLNKDIWKIPNCDGRNGTLIESANVKLRDLELRKSCKT